MAKTRIKYAIALDVETGGLPNPQKGKFAFADVALTEVAMVVVNLEKLQIEENASWLVSPHYFENLEYNEKAAEVSGISIDLLKEKGVPIEQVYKESAALLKKYSSGAMGLPVLVGHNIVKFDSPFLKNLYLHFDDDFDSYIAGYEDTMLWASYKFLESANYKLGTICQHLGVELTDAHRALSDTLATAQLFISFVKFLRAENLAKTEKDNGNKLNDRIKLDVKYDL